MTDFIEVSDNLISEEFCNKFVEYFELLKSHDLTRTAQSDSNLSGLEREDKSLFLPNDVLKTFDSELFPIEFTNQYMKLLNSRIEDYLKKYPKGATEGLYCPIIKIHQVEESEGYHEWHCESFNRTTMDRHCVFMTYLEEPESGGETEFLYQKKRIEPVKGRTVIWPCGFTHIHRGNPVLKGRKTYITGWYSFK